MNQIKTFLHGETISSLFFSSLLISCTGFQLILLLMQVELMKCSEMQFGFTLLGNTGFNCPSITTNAGLLLWDLPSVPCRPYHQAMSFFATEGLYCADTKGVESKIHICAMIGSKTESCDQKYMFLETNNIKYFYLLQ